MTHDPAALPPCPRCHAAHLIADALAVISPEDCTVENPRVTDCGTVAFDVVSDCGDYGVVAVVD